MGVGLVRSLQPPDILLIHWRVYNSTANTSKGVLFLPPSDAYVRSFLYLFYTLIKLYYTKVRSDQALSSPLEAKNPGVFRGSATTFHVGGSSRILQDKVRMLGALVLCSPSRHIFCCTLLTLLCASVNEWHDLRETSGEPCSAVPWCSYMAYGRNLSGNYADLPRPRDTQHPCEGSSQRWTKCVEQSLLSWSNFPVSLTIS